MITNEYSFPSRDGKTPLHTVEWLPEGAPRAVVQIAHGVSEYAARYQPLAAFLTERGFAVTGNDHIGHGLSLAPGAPAAD
ncbi:MAG: alpha/beta hydrolase [Oscillibacter sp.]|jgi:alpha-beta hydrolase superfamily lysophospholipase|nr:alpha/beta hydrolase [Oscillibacter sp.]